MLTWDDLCADKRFHDLPYKVETNGRGQVLMSPTSYFHGKHANRIARLLEQFRPEGEVIVECAVETADGVKEADVAWLSPGLAATMQEVTACPTSPEICVEVISPSNTEQEMMQKRLLFIGAGAREYWLCDREGRMRFFDGHHQLENSQLVPEFPPVLPAK